jgi:aspartyl/glutamyl-tRNA(Asn/Gln) amidotransferase C subunit
MSKQTPIDSKLTNHLGELAKISLSVEQQSKLRSKLQQLIDAFSELPAADVSPSDHDEDGGHKVDRPAITTEGLREDTATPPLTTEEVLANAPQRTADRFVVKRVLEP